MWKSIEETKKTPFLFFLSWIMMNFHDARSEIREREEGESARRHGNGTHGTHGLMFRVPLFRPAAAAVSCSIWNDSKVQSLVGVGRQRTQPEESQPESEATAKRASRTCVPHVSARAGRTA